MTTTPTKRATVHLEPDLHRALRLKSAETLRSVSDLVNEAIRADLAEDAGDLNAFNTRKDEPTIAFGEFVKRLTAPEPGRAPGRGRGRRGRGGRGSGCS